MGDRVKAVSIAPLDPMMAEDHPGSIRAHIHDRLGQYTLAAGNVGGAKTLLAA
jgi:hypothetical protein